VASLAAGAGRWSYRPGDRALRFNDTVAGWLGCEHGCATLPLTAVAERVHPEDLRQLTEHLGQPGRSAVAQELRLLDPRHPGHWRHVQLHVTREPAAAGGDAAFHGIAVDITPLRRDVRRARTLVQRLEGLGLEAGVGYWNLRHGAHGAYWGPLMYRLHGIPAGQPLPGWLAWLKAHVPAEERAALRRAVRAWLRGGAEHFEHAFRLVGRDGTVHDVVCHARLRDGDGARRPYGLLMDVTARLSAERQAQVAAERSAFVSRSLGLAHWEEDMRTGTAVWDEQMWRLRGREPRPVAPDLAQGSEMLDPADRDAMRALASRRTSSTAPMQYEFRVRWPDGTVRWLASRSVAEHDAQGRPLRRFGLNWDITDVRQARAAVEQQQATARELRAKARFLARLSHELKTPLHAVMGFTQLLQHAPPDLSDAARQEWLARIELAGRHIATLIDDVLHLASSEGGELPVQCEPVQLTSVADAALQMTESLAREHRVTVHRRPGPWRVMADPVRLRQVLINLLSNAIKYNRPGGQVWLDVHELPPGVQLVVRDDGKGLSLEQQAHLFEPFNRLGAETSGIPGTGMGLAIARSLVQRMGGRLQLHSQIGVGTLVRVDLPAPPPGVDEAQPPQGATAVPAVRGRILYIEDNVVNTLIVGELVSQYPGLELRCAEDGALGLAMAARWQPDWVLLDMQLPDMTGEEVFARMKSDPRLARIPCTALSANALPADMRRVLDAGFADYWTKPLDFRRFHEAVQQRLTATEPAVSAG
jgi:hypothetical protein